MERLPDDLWETILTRLLLNPRPYRRLLPYRPLQSVSLVCKRFLALSNRMVNIFAVDPSIIPVPLQTLFYRFPNITSFHLCRDPDLDASVTLLADSGLLLRSLHLSGLTHFPKEAMRLLGDRMSGTLRSLSCVEFNVMTDDDLALVAGSFPYLQQFDIKSRGDVTDRGILEISTKLKSLVSVNILYQKHLTHRSVEYLVSNCPSLRDLQFSVGDYMRMDQLDPFHLFLSLSTLHLERAKLSRKVLVRLSKVGLKLEKLIFGVPHVTGDVTGQTLCEFLKSCPSLRHLELSHFWFPPDTNFIELAASLPNIQVIKLVGKPLTMLRPATLLYLLRKCPLLEEIAIECFFLGITPDWFNNSSAKYVVRKLNLKYCNDLRDETLKLLVSVCPQLEALYLAFCPKITLKGIEAVVASCNYIKVVYAAYCCNFEHFHLYRN